MKTKKPLALPAALNCQPKSSGSGSGGNQAHSPEIKSATSAQTPSPHVGGYSSRQFLKLAGAAILAGSAWPKSAQANVPHVGGKFSYEGGVVFNPDLPGLSGQLILNV